MCTAIAMRTKDRYFGRNLDLAYCYREAVTVVPRNFPFSFRMAGKLEHHYAMIGTATVVEGYPLYYDAGNEKGLCMAGLNFPGNADYKSPAAGKDNVSPFEFIPWILGQCCNLAEVRTMLEKINLANINFSEEMPLTPLHWMISDGEGSIVVESVTDGLKVYDNPAEVLTNNPAFDMHLFNLNNYMHLTPQQPENRFSEALDLKHYSAGLGALGLPGDLSSMSRFVRAVFMLKNSCCGDSEEESVSQFFHILGSVAQPRGCACTVDGGHMITRYSSCCSADRGIYYYTTYENSRITGVDMRRENLDADALVSYPLIREMDIFVQNQ